MAGAGAVAGSETAARHQRRQSTDPHLPPKRPALDCTAISFTQPRWFAFEPLLTAFNATAITAIDADIRGDFRFTALNLATNFTAHCDVRNVVLSPLLVGGGNGTWFNCTDPDTQFRFELSTMRLEIQQSWVCKDTPTQVFLSSL
jgi:hypothetical protein